MSRARAEVPLVDDSALLHGVYAAPACRHRGLSIDRSRHSRSSACSAASNAPRPATPPTSPARSRPTVATASPLSGSRSTTAPAQAYGLGGRGAVILAAINKIETNFGTNHGPSPAGAVGWMQFMPDTWTAYGVDADDDGTRDPADPTTRSPPPPTPPRLRPPGGLVPGDLRLQPRRLVRPRRPRPRRPLPGRLRTHHHRPAAAPGGDGQLHWPKTVRTITGRFGEQRPGLTHTRHRHRRPARRTGHGRRGRTVVLVQDTASSGGYGNYVCAQHGPKLRTCYAHLSPVSVRVRQRVAAHGVIGACGNKGHSFGAHLHFEVRVPPGWVPTDRWSGSISSRR